MRSSTSTLISALRVLASEDDSECGTVGGALFEAADRLEEHQKLLRLVSSLIQRIASEILTSHDQRIASLVHEYSTE
jgi:hypothetical protein